MSQKRASKFVLSDVRWRRRQRRHRVPFSCRRRFCHIPACARVKRRDESRRIDLQGRKRERKQAKEREYVRKGEIATILLFFSRSRKGDRATAGQRCREKRREAFSRVDDSSPPSFVSTSLSDILLSSPFIHLVVFTRPD